MLVFYSVWSLPQENMLINLFCIILVFLNLACMTLIDIMALRAFSEIEDFHEILVESLVDVLNFEFLRLIHLIFATITFLRHNTGPLRFRFVAIVYELVDDDSVWHVVKNNLLFNHQLKYFLLLSKSEF